MQSLAAIELSVSRQSFGATPGFSRLYRDYCESFDHLAEFYSVDYRDPKAIVSRAETVAAVARDRPHLVQTLLSQNEAWGLDDATRQNIESLGGADSVAVVTGQQVGILGGPLYTIYKTATAIKLARELATASDRPVVPVFWLEGEDHDLDEVKSVTILSRNEPVTLTYQVPPMDSDGNYGPVGRIKLTDAVVELVDQLEDLLPPTDFKPELLRRIRDAYKPGVSMRTAFARLLKSFFPSEGLVFISPDDRRFKSSAVPLFVKEVEESSDLVDAILRTSSRLESDYHIQVNVSPTNLFLVDENGRFAIDAVGQRYQVRGRDLSFTRDELVSRIKDDPCCISPNVVLRPILQDRLLPTVAYVGGPGEIAYFAQFKPSYEWAGLPMPVIYPRASVTLVESKVQKLLSSYGLDVSDAHQNVNDLFRMVVLEQMKVDLDAEFQGAARHLHQAINEIKSVVASLDGSLAKSVESTRAALLKEWKRLEERVLKAEKRRHDEDRDRLARLQHNLFPKGRLQERSLSIVYFLNKYGPGFIEELQGAVSSDTREHQIVEIQSQ